MIKLTQEQLNQINAEAMPIHAVCILADMIGDNVSLLSIDAYLTDPTSESAQSALNLYAQQVFMLTQERVVNHEEVLARFLVKESDDE